MDEGLTIKISGDIADFKESLKQTQDAVADLSKNLAGSAKEVSTTWAVALGEIGAHFFEEVLSEAWNKVKEIITESIAASERHTDALNAMNIALASTGKYSKQTSEDMAEFAHHVQQTTAFEEDQVLQSSALIETLAHLDKDGLQKATMAAINLSAAMKIDLHEASLLVGKAAEGNVSAFKRFGLEVQEGATKSETYANALAKIASLGNVAEQQANTYSGALAQLKNTQEDGRKTLGSYWEQNVAVISVIKEVTSILGDNNEATKKNGQAYRELVAEGLILAIKAMQGIVVSLDAIERVGMVTFEVLAVQTKVFVAAIVAAQQALSGNWKEAWDGFKTNAVSAINDVKKAATEDHAGLDAISNSLVKIQNAAEKGFEAVKKGAIASIAPVNQSAQAQVQATAVIEADQKKAYEAILKRIKNIKEIRDTNMQDEITAEKKKIATILANTKSGSDLELEIKGNAAKEELEIKKATTDALTTITGNFATLQNSKTKELAAFGKASAIAQTTIATYSGATKAAASAADIPFVGWALGPLVAASFIAAGLANVASIAGIGFAEGGMMSGGIAGVDSIPAMYQPGELVVPTKNFDEVVDDAASRRSGGSGADTTVLLQFNDDFGKVVEASIVKRQRQGTSILKKIT